MKNDVMFKQVLDKL